jgi:hypothetical protein
MNIRRATNGQLAEMMGCLASYAEADRFGDILLEMGFIDTDDVPEDDWHSALSRAVWDPRRDGDDA